MKIVLLTAVPDHFSARHLLKTQNLKTSLLHLDTDESTQLRAIFPAPHKQSEQIDGSNSQDLDMQAWRKEKVQKTDKFIVFAPIRRSDLPAKVKARYENVFVAKFAYRYSKN